SYLRQDEACIHASTKLMPVIERELRAVRTRLQPHCKMVVMAKGGPELTWIRAARLDSALGFQCADITEDGCPMVEALAMRYRTAHNCGEHELVAQRSAIVRAWTRVALHCPR